MKLLASKISASKISASKILATLALAALAFTLPAPFMAQNTTAAQPQAKSARTTPKPQTKEAPGADPHKVWVNTTSNVYHCPGDRYYGRTKAGKYMTESEAKAAGAHGEKGHSCFK